VVLYEVRRLARDGTSIDELVETYAACEAETERANPGLRYPEVIARSTIATGAIHGVTVPSEMAARGRCYGETCKGTQTAPQKVSSSNIRAEYRQWRARPAAAKV
jgi:hypothetical protein